MKHFIPSKLNKAKGCKLNCPLRSDTDHTSDKAGCTQNGLDGWGLRDPESPDDDSPPRMWV